MLVSVKSDADWNSLESINFSPETLAGFLVEIIWQNRTKARGIYRMGGCHIGYLDT